MGFDIHGKNELSFHTSNWGWRPLWRYCEEVAPRLAGKVKSAQYNDGDGLDAADAEELGRVLMSELNSGQTAAYEQKRAAAIRALPDEVCNICGGTGKRTDMEVAHGCNKCLGDGKVRPDAVHYPFDTETVEQFARFLLHCGGFTID